MSQSTHQQHGRSLSVLDDPAQNRGVAYTQEQRRTLGITGRLPTAVLSLDEQAARAHRQLQAQPDDLAKNVFLEELHDSDETLYFKVLMDHLTELLPVVYDPTVGMAIEQYSHEYRRRGDCSCPSTNRRRSRRRSQGSDWALTTST